MVTQRFTLRLITPLISTVLLLSLAPVKAQHQKVAFTNFNNDTGVTDIFVMNADGSNVLNVTNNTAVETSIDLSPDGSKVAFASDSSGDYEIYTININGTNLTRLTTSPLFEYSPTWSPLGNKIAFSSGFSGHNDIFVMDSNGADKTNITDSSHNEIYPVWSPNEDVIAFVSDKSGNYELYTINADGSNYTQLTTLGYNSVGQLSWSPDGTMLAFYAQVTLSQSTIYRINKIGTDLTPILTEGESNRFIWLSNSQLLYDSNATNGYNTVNIDGTNIIPVNLNWPRYAEVSLPANWQPPVLTPNLPPTAEAGSNQTVIADHTGTGLVTLTGTSGHDPEGQIIRSTWYEGDRQRCGLSHPEDDCQLSFGIGSHTLTFTITDDRNNSSSDTVVITLLEMPGGTLTATPLPPTKTPVQAANTPISPTPTSITLRSSP